MDNPSISIIVPCYNQAHFLDATLESVYLQTYKNWECIIVNDGSPDNTNEVADRWIKKDSKFKYIYQENGGLSNARNTGLKNAKGDYLICLDSDDILHKQKLEKSVVTLIAEKSQVVVTNFLRFKSSIKQLRPAHCKLSLDLLNYESILLNWDRKFTFPPHTVMFSKNLIKDIRFNENLKAKEDWFFWLDIFKQKPNTSYIKEPLVFYRKNPNGMTKNFQHMQTNRSFAYITIFENLKSSDLKKSFLSKIIDDSADRLMKQNKRLLKYEKISKILIVICLILCVLLVISLNI